MNLMVNGSASRFALTAFGLLWILGACDAPPDPGDPDRARSLDFGVGGRPVNKIVEAIGDPGGIGSTTARGGAANVAGGPNSPNGNFASLDNIYPLTLPNSSFTKVPYTDELYDNWNQFNTDTNRFTSWYGHAYHVCAALSRFSTDFELDLFVNGARENSLAISKRGGGQGCRTIRLASGQYVEVWAYQSLASSLSFGPSYESNWLTIDEQIWSMVSLDDITAFTAPVTTFTTVPFTSELYDQNGDFDITSGRFTARWGFDYRFCVSTASFVPEYEVDLFVNGARENAFALSNYGAGLGCRTVHLSAGDYVEAKVYQNSGAPMTFAPNSTWNWMTVDAVDGQVSLDNTTPFTAYSNNTVTVPYTNELYDDYGQFDTQTSRFTANYDEKYSVCASLASFSGDFQLFLRINGLRENAIAVSTHGVGLGCRTVRLKQGDYLEVVVYQNTGVAIAFAPNQYWNWMTVNGAQW